MDVWNKVCRACLSTKEESFTYFLFDNISPEMYCFCTSIELTEDENLPKSICNKCYSLLVKLTEFKQTCLKSEKNLLSFSNNAAEDSIDVVDSIHQDDIDSFEAKFDVNILLKTEDITNYDHNIPQNKKEVLKKIHKEAKSCKRKKKFKNKKHRTKVKEPTEPYEYSCELCSKRFRLEETYEAHKQEHEGKRVSYHCKPCDKPFATWSGFKRHKDSVHTPVSLDLLSCKVCGRICKNQRTLYAHEKAHGPRSACMCHVCGKNVASDFVLKSHLETHKPDRERRHTCEHCGKKFFTNTTLLAHIARQHTGRRYICDYCNYPFTDKHNLAKHIRIHEGKKFYSCDICNKPFTTNGSLVEHKRIHSGERPFPCKYCVKSFVSKRRLIDHIRVHTGEKPFACTLCELRFTQRGTMQRHMKVHDKVVTVTQMNQNHVR